MQFTAKAKYIRYSPYKLRPIVDLVRKKQIPYVLQLLATYKLKRIIPIRKVINSAISNAQDREKIGAEMLIVEDIRVDQGPTYRYFRPGAMGKSNAYRKKFSHIQVTLGLINRLHLGSVKKIKEKG